MRIFSSANLDKSNSHYLQVEKALSVGTDQDNRNRLFFCRSIACDLADVSSEIKKANVHKQISVAVEAGQADWDPAFAATSFNSFRFKDHVEQEL